MKKPLYQQKREKEKWQQKRHQKFEYTAIEEWLRTVSWSNNCHPAGVVNRNTLLRNCKNEQSSICIEPVDLSLDHLIKV